MNDIITAVLMVVLCVILVSVYTYSFGRIFPKYVIKRRYKIQENLGRGLKKFTFKNGRAVIYEPHPSIRKYISKYALVVKDGHKYLECNIDAYVKRFTYTVVMLNNKNKVIDVIEVDDYVPGAAMGHPVYLHADTSYVALILRCVNGEKLPDTDSHGYYRMRDILLFGALSAIGGFFAYFTFSSAFDVFISCVNAEPVVYSFDFFAALGASFLVGIISAVALLLFCNRRNVRVVFND